MLRSSIAVGLADTKPRKVWAFMGDGEMDEPESLGAISLGGREHLDNLVFVINCNLTVKGYDMGESGEGQMIWHQAEENERGGPSTISETFNIPVSDEQLKDVPFVRLAAELSGNEISRGTSRRAWGTLASPPACPRR